MRDLLDLARSDDLRLAPCDPRQLLDRIRGRLRAQKLLDEVEFVQVASPTLPEVETDPRRVEQILVNLIENAAHALSGQPHARIELGARETCARLRRVRREGDAAAADHSEARAPDAVALCVTDNGPGIDAQALSEIFDPFFTTKDPGEGTGLGLWNAHRLAELLGGRLEVESRPGSTCFSLVLPLADREQQDGAAPRTDR